jgi:methylmalonyl-CoA mutase C-terminal domain/subunit
MGQQNLDSQRLRFLLACDTSGHTAGYYVVAQGLRDAGMEVITLGHSEPAGVADAALQEDIDFIGYRISDRDAVTLISSLIAAMEERGMSQVPIVVGGIIRREAVPVLKKMGVTGVFGPGSRIPDIADFVYANRSERHSGGSS